MFVGPFISGGGTPTKITQASGTVSVGSDGSITITPAGSTNVTLAANQFLVPDGSLAAPALAFSAKTNTGIFHRTLGLLAFVSNAIEVVEIQSVLVNGWYSLVLRGASPLQWCSGEIASTGLDSGLQRIAPKVIGANDGTQTGAGWLQQTAGRSRNTADVTNTTTTFSNLSDLSVTLIAGRKYTGRLVIKCINSTATEGLKFDLAGGTATMTSMFAGAGILASGGTDVIGANISTTLAGVINFTTFTGESVVVIELSLVVNAGGTFIPRFAENSTAVGTATVRAGSFLWLEDSPN